ncbi:MAG: hypothetical protein K2L62_01315 [Muribaculaceae bacterium]|nr:hypothetical protein [Muribaculaceae bacterium]
MRECLGGIYEFLEKKKIASLRELEQSKPAGKTTARPAQPEATADALPKSHSASGSAAAQPKLTYAEQRERDKMLRRAAKKVEEAEAAVAATEQDIADIEARIAAGETDGDIFDLHARKNRDLENAMSLWELAEQELQELKNRFDYRS